jgi:hypothetical protein
MCYKNKLAIIDMFFYNIDNKGGYKNNPEKQKTFHSKRDDFGA